MSGQMTRGLTKKHRPVQNKRNPSDERRKMGLSCDQQGKERKSRRVFTITNCTGARPRKRTHQGEGENLQTRKERVVTRKLRKTKLEAENQQSIRRAPTNQERTKEVGQRRFERQQRSSLHLLSKPNSLGKPDTDRGGGT